MAATVVINGTVYAGAAQVSLTGQSGGKSTYLYITGDPSLISPRGAMLIWKHRHSQCA